MIQTVRLWLLLLALLSLGCETAEPELYLFEGSAMGTSYSVKVVAGELPDQEQTRIGDAVAGVIAEIDQKMSTYREDSELSRLNQTRENEAVPVSRETLAVFEEARAIGELSGGALDVTVGPLVNAFGFGPDKQRRSPAADEVARLRGLVGWDKIVIDNAASTVSKKAAEVYCDLSAVAKGYGVDRAAEMLRALGYSRYMVEIGGEVRASGLNQEDRPWRIAVERPTEGERSIERVLGLKDVSLATSGDYRNYYEQDGVRISHTIDPRTGRPIAHRLASVSVVESTCLRADGWATALLALGEEDGFRLAVERELAAIFLVRNDTGGFDERATPAFEEAFPTPDQ